MASKASEETDQLAQESRQLNRLYGNGNNKLSASSTQQSTDYYDYYDYSPAVNNVQGAGGNGNAGKLGNGNVVANNLAQKKALLQQRNGQLSRLGGAASSGVGAYSGHHASYSEEYCDNGISIALLLTALLGIAVMFYVLYTKITKGRRRRRSTEELDVLEEKMNPIWFAVEHLQDLVFSGLEEFENKVDQIAAGHEENSWISSLYKKFSDNFISGNVDAIQDDQMDGMEPPMLDETWGLEDIQRLHQENSTDSMFGSDSMIVEENVNKTMTLPTRSSQIKGDSGNSSNIFKKKDADDDESLKNLSGDAKCTTKFWRCLGSVIQGGAHYLQEPGGITNAVQKALFRVAFHGGFGNVWGALMSIPEARQVKKCMNEKDECLSYEILKREADATLDDSPRMIINPDFVEGLDDSDGVNQFNAEDQKKFDEEMGEDEEEENEIEDTKMKIE